MRQQQTSVMNTVIEEEVQSDNGGMQSVPNYE